MGVFCFDELGATKGGIQVAGEGHREADMRKIRQLVDFFLKQLKHPLVDAIGSLAERLIEGGGIGEAHTQFLRIPHHLKMWTDRLLNHTRYFFKEIRAEKLRPIVCTCAPVIPIEVVF